MLTVLAVQRFEWSSSYIWRWWNCSFLRTCMWLPWEICNYILKSCSVSVSWFNCILCMKKRWNTKMHSQDLMSILVVPPCHNGRVPLFPLKTNIKWAVRIWKDVCTPERLSQVALFWWTLALTRTLLRCKQLGLSLLLMFSASDE